MERRGDPDEGEDRLGHPQCHPDDHDRKRETFLHVIRRQGQGLSHGGQNLAVFASKHGK